MGALAETQGRERDIRDRSGGPAQSKERDLHLLRQSLMCLGARRWNEDVVVPADPGVAPLAIFGNGRVAVHNGLSSRGHGL